jgi:hypothetical protein
VHNLYQIIQSYIANAATDDPRASNGGFAGFTSRAEQLAPSNEKGGLFKPDVGSGGGGGLSVPQFKAPTARTSALGLDKLAAQKRQEAEQKARMAAQGVRNGPAARIGHLQQYDDEDDMSSGDASLGSRGSRADDASDERNNSSNDMGSVPFRKRYRDQQMKRPETPSHPGGVDSHALDRIKSRFVFMFIQFYMLTRSLTFFFFFFFFFF